MAAPTSKAGIQRLSNGDSIIPSSTRADGSVRKEIRVKPGYKPPEDVEVYKNRTAHAFKNRGKGAVPGAERVDGDEVANQSAASAKNAKRKEMRKKAAAAAGEGKESADDGGQMVESAQAPQVEEVVDPKAEKAKEARKLAKKLRQARELQSKKEQGDSLLPEQFAKVIRINELLRQLETLGFDADGEERPQPDETAG